jgi:hypothetical protein
MTIALGTASEMTKGWMAGPFDDNPLKMPTFAFYQISY